MAEVEHALVQLQNQDGGPDMQQSNGLSDIDTTLPTGEIDTRRFSKEERKTFEPPKDENGHFYCDYPDPLSQECTNLRFNRKCEYHKHMDKHLRPHVCQVPDCKQPGFTYPGGLRRHEAEVHGMHGGPKEVLYCPYPYCKRNSGEPFTRRENMQEHISRLHTKSKESKESKDAEEATAAGGSDEQVKDQDATDGITDPSTAVANMVVDGVQQQQQQQDQELQHAPSVETLAAAAGAIDPNIDPSFTQDMPGSAVAVAVAAQSTPTTTPGPKGKKRKTGRATFKESEYTPSAQDASLIRELTQKVALLEEQNGRLHVHNAELVDENNYLRDTTDALREENVGFREALTGLHASGP